MSLSLAATESRLEFRHFRTLLRPTGSAGGLAAGVLSRLTVATLWEKGTGGGDRRRYQSTSAGLVLR
jgi:hypothetical protein